MKVSSFPFESRGLQSCNPMSAWKKNLSTETPTRGIGDPSALAWGWSLHGNPQLNPSSWALTCLLWTLLTAFNKRYLGFLLILSSLSANKLGWGRRCGWSEKGSQGLRWPWLFQGKGGGRNTEGGGLGTFQVQQPKTHLEAPKLAKKSRWCPQRKLLV